MEIRTYKSLIKSNLLDGVKSNEIFAGHGPGFKPKLFCFSVLGYIPSSLSSEGKEYDFPKMLKYAFESEEFFLLLKEEELKSKEKKMPNGLTDLEIDYHIRREDSLEGSEGAFYFLRVSKNGLIQLVVIDHDGSYFVYYSANDDDVFTFGESFKKPKENNGLSRIHIMTKDPYEGLYFKKFEMPIPEIDIELNYGKEFIADHNLIVKKLSTNPSGVYLWHGPAGTGKTSYIRYLSKIIDRDFLFVPTGFVGEMVAPDFISVLLRHPNSILVIEDGEKAIESRTDSNNSGLVSSLLNISDGFLGTVLKTSIMITYNISDERIDSALKRKGRLQFKKEFKKLSIENAQRLVDKLGKDYKVEEEMSLAEIYCLDDKVEVEEQAEEEKRNENKRIGFF